MKRWEYMRGRAWIELSRENLRKNVDYIKGMLAPEVKLMPALKANAYGHGAIPLAKELNRLQIRHFCVASIEEGVQLRKNGIKGEILILGYTHPRQFSLLAKYRLTQTVLDYAYACTLGQHCREKVLCHIAIDTGMHRLGESAENLKEIAEIFGIRNLEIKGIYTHLYAAESRNTLNQEITLQQANALNQVVAYLRSKGYVCDQVHILASNGIMNYPELGGELARPGAVLYGVLSNRDDMSLNSSALMPVLTLKARIALIRDISIGESVGYGLAFIADRKYRIAVLTIGYADGIPRHLSCGKGNVLIRGCRAPVIGKICMDQMMVDITEIPDVKNGEVAILIGRSGDMEISAYDIAEACETNTVEVLSRLGSRLERIVV